jgi:hypothetical protein
VLPHNTSLIEAFWVVGSLSGLIAGLWVIRRVLRSYIGTLASRVADDVDRGIARLFVLVAAKIELTYIVFLVLGIVTAHNPSPRIAEVDDSGHIVSVPQHVTPGQIVISVGLILLLITGQFVLWYWNHVWVMARDAGREHREAAAKVIGST